MKNNSKYIQWIVPIVVLILSVMPIDCHNIYKSIPRMPITIWIVRKCEWDEKK